MLGCICLSDLFKISSDGTKSHTQPIKLTSMSLEPLLIEALTTAGTMGLPADGELVPELCCGTLGETGSTLTRAGAEPMQTDWDKTTTRGRKGGAASAERSKHGELRDEWRSSPGWLCSTECRPWRMRVLAAAGLWLTGTEATHIGLGWMGGLLFRMVLAFSVAELGRPGGANTKAHISP